MSNPLEPQSPATAVGEVGKRLFEMADELDEGMRFERPETRAQIKLMREAGRKIDALKRELNDQTIRYRFATQIAGGFLSGTDEVDRIVTEAEGNAENTRRLYLIGIERFHKRFDETIDAALKPLRAKITSLESEKEAMRKVVDAAQKWRASRTEYLIECEIALSAQAPLEGGTRYRAHAAASSMAASDLVAALQALSIPSQGERQP